MSVQSWRALLSAIWEVGGCGGMRTTANMEKADGRRDGAGVRKTEERE